MYSQFYKYENRSGYLAEYTQPSDEGSNKTLMPLKQVLLMSISLVSRYTSTDFAAFQLAVCTTQSLRSSFAWREVSSSNPKHPPSYLDCRKANNYIGSCPSQQKQLPSVQPSILFSKEY